MNIYGHETAIINLYGMVCNNPRRISICEKQSDIQNFIKMLKINKLQRNITPMC
jgi:hypothetical protein